LNRPSLGFLRQRSFWGVCLGQFCHAYLFYFMLTWLPFYLVQEQHLAMQNMVRTAALYYLTDAVSAIGTGWFSDVWIRRGYTPTVVRKTIMAIGFAIAAIAMTACAARPDTYLPWLINLGIRCGISGANLFAFSQTLAGPSTAGRWTGLQNGFGNLAGVIAPALTGFAVERTGSFTMAMTITTVTLIIGGLAWVFVVGRVEQLSWPTKSDALIAATAVIP
jgi:MFS transporter, ACS family, D-galactonate transporter